MKSNGVTVMFPTWMWIDWAESRWLFASYSASLSTKHSIDRRTIIQSDYYRRRWGHKYRLAGDQNLKTEYSNSRRGTMIATSVGGTATGKGGDFIIVDDPQNPEEAESDTEREKGIRFFDQTLSTRLDDLKKGVIIVVMQRLHEMDLTGHILAEIGGYEHLKLPGEFETKTTIVMPGGKSIVKEQGDLLCPDRMGRKELDALKKSLGSYGYGCQVLQEPSPKAGGMFKRDKWKFYRVAPSFDQIIESWDCTFKDLDASKGKKVDFVCGQVWGRKLADFYLLDQFLAQVDFPGTLQAIITLSAKWPLARTKLVEDKANGPAVVAMLKGKVPGIREVSPEGGKISRANAVAPLQEAGNVYLPDPLLAPWVHDYIECFAKFPRVPFDDQVDATSQALLYLYTKAMEMVRTFAQKPRGW
jgi:predicted phage terminase large subunit-like protein